MNLDGRFHGCFRHIKDIAKIVVFFLFFAFFNGKDAIFRQKSRFFGKNPIKLDILQVRFALMSRLLKINNVCRSFSFRVLLHEFKPLDNICKLPLLSTLIFVISCLQLGVFLNFCFQFVSFVLLEC